MVLKVSVAERGAVQSHWPAPPREGHGVDLPRVVEQT